MAILPESSLSPERKTGRSIKTTCQFSRLRWLRGLATTFTERRDGFDARGRDAATESAARIVEMRQQRQISMTPAAVLSFR
jgi:hypothetical protein